MTISCFESPTGWDAARILGDPEYSDMGLREPSGRSADLFMENLLAGNVPVTFWGQDRGPQEQAFQVAAWNASYRAWTATQRLLLGTHLQLEGRRRFAEYRRVFGRRR